MLVFSLLFIMYHYFVFANSNSCTDDCNANFPDGVSINFCGTDGISYSTTHDAIDGYASNYCYLLDCNIAALYQGICGCPNGCYSNEGKGECITDVNDISICVCDSQWSGYDCSLPSITNICSNNGEIINDNDGSFICICNDNYTGIDCSTNIFEFGNAPWGNILPSTSDEEYQPSDEYGDNHPIFNVSTLASIRVTMLPDDYVYLLTPSNFEANNNYVHSNITFYNNKYNFTMKNIGIKLKGAFSRFDLKKGWNFKFNEFISGQNLMGVKKLGLKPGGAGGDCLLKNMIYTNFQRGMGVPVTRGSYSLLYINDIYVGIYFMNEVVDSSFIKNRYSNDNGKGNLYKCAHTYLQYFGNNVTFYQSINELLPDGTPQYDYDQDGNGNWSDLIDVLKFAQTSSDIEFEAEIAYRLDISMFLRGLVVESFMMSEDGFIGQGNNYYFYHSNNKDLPLQFSQFNNDFDEEFSFDSLGSPNSDPNVMNFILVDPIDDSEDDSLNPPKKYNPFIQRVLAIEYLYHQFLNYYKEFLTIYNYNSLQQPSDRYNALLQFTFPWVQKDKIWQIGTGNTANNFMYAAMNNSYNLNWRNNNVAEQLICLEGGCPTNETKIYPNDINYIFVLFIIIFVVLIIIGLNIWYTTYRGISSVSLLYESKKNYLNQN